MCSSMRRPPVAVAISPAVIGTPSSAAAQLRDLAQTFDVDEIMVHPVAGALRGTPSEQAPAREQTLRLLGEAVAPTS